MRSVPPKVIPRTAHVLFRLYRLGNNSFEHDPSDKSLFCFLRLPGMPQRCPIVTRVDRNVPESSVPQEWTCSDSNHFKVVYALEKVIGLAVTHILKLRGNKSSFQADSPRSC